MEGELADQAGSTVALLTGIAFVVALLMAGLMTAFFRINNLYRNGLLEEASLGRVLREYLRTPRHFQVTVSTLYLLATAVGCFGWGKILADQWGGALSLRFYVVFAGTALVAWTFGGVLAKLVAAGTPRTYGRVVGTLVFPLHWVMRPWSVLLRGVMDRLDDTLWTGEALPHLSSGEIRSLMEDDEENVILDEDEREMIHGIFHLQDTVVREIMIPRIDMVSLDVSQPIDEVVRTVNETQHSRIPVHEGNIDKVIGILYSKDLLNLFDGGRNMATSQGLRDLIRPAYFIPESKKIDEVLDEFRSKHIHMAVVIDEYGGTAGLVTLEDVLEEIVGEIEDEFDDREQLFAWVDEQTLRVDPKIDLEDVEQVLGVSMPTDSTETSETLGGLIYEAAGSVPVQGDRVELDDLTVTVEEVADQRILRVLVRSEQPFPGYARRNPAGDPAG